MDQLFDKLFGDDHLFLAVIELELFAVFCGFFIYLTYLAITGKAYAKSAPSLGETERLLAGHMDRIVGEYFYKEYEAFEKKHNIIIGNYTTPELLALCEEKGWTNDVFYSLLFVDYNEFAND
jgi:hypothetical protein